VRRDRMHETLDTVVLTRRGSMLTEEDGDNAGKSSLESTWMGLSYT
jgi:hypothetical protein